MEQSKEYSHAKKRVEAKMGFYTHFAVFVAVALHGFAHGADDFVAFRNISRAELLHAPFFAHTVEFGCVGAGYQRGILAP